MAEAGRSLYKFGQVGLCGEFQVDQGYMVRACPNQNITLTYLACVHVAVREPTRRDLPSPSTL